MKVENTADAYPLAGLQNADVVYEEMVEGGITRFMALYQCQSSPRVGPVRSARTTDPRVLLQFGPRSMLSYSGGQLAVVNDIARSTLMSFDETTGGDAFSRDDSRVMPHNLFLNVTKLWAREARLHGRMPGHPGGCSRSMATFRRARSAYRESPLTLLYATPLPGSGCRPAGHGSGSWTAPR